MMEICKHYGRPMEENGIKYLCEECKEKKSKELSPSLAGNGFEHNLMEMD